MVPPKCKHNIAHYSASIIFKLSYNVSKMQIYYAIFLSRQFSHKTLGTDFTFPNQKDQLSV